MTPITTRVYLAGRSEDQPILQALRDALTREGIGCTSRWLNGFDSDPFVGARNDLEDIARADVFVLYNPAHVHRTGTGGRHFETGYAWSLRRPILLVGTPENIFQPYVANITLPDVASPGEIAIAINLARG